jgi:hypothetical protein
VNSIFCFGWTFRFFGLSDGSINCFIGSKFQVPTVATVEFTIGYSRFFVITKFISKLTKRQFRKSILIFILHWAVVFTHLKKQHVALGGVFSIFLPKIFFFFFSSQMLIFKMIIFLLFSYTGYVSRCCHVNTKFWEKYKKFISN